VAGVRFQRADADRDNVWLGANVVVASGVTIGERCVIGANSLVTQDIPAFSIAAGAPAKILRTITYNRRPDRPLTTLCNLRRRWLVDQVASTGWLGYLAKAANPANSPAA
jgi:tetrahydrodipicolinate N-succinyltransferase